MGVIKEYIISNISVSPYGEENEEKRKAFINYLTVMNRLDLLNQVEILISFEHYPYYFCSKPFDDTIDKMLQEHFNLKEKSYDKNNQTA